MEGWLDRLSVEFLEQDLFSVPADALMCPVTDQLEAYGKISQAVFKRLGGVAETLLADAHVKEGEGHLALGSSKAFDLRHAGLQGSYRWLVMTALWSRESEYSYQLYYGAYASALREALAHKAVSMVLPVLAYDGTLRAGGKALVDVILDFAKLAGSAENSLADIFVVSSKSQHIEYLREHEEPRIYR